jgi:hypothetical protein
MDNKKCQGVSPYTGIACKKLAVKPYTVMKGSEGTFLDIRFCQMHQPGYKSKKKCVCPYCTYHRSREPVKVETPQDKIKDKIIT